MTFDLDGLADDDDRPQIAALLDSLDADLTMPRTVRCVQQSGMNVPMRFQGRGTDDPHILVGSYSDSLWDRRRFVHEVGHAWDDQHLTDTHRQRMLDQWGFTDWFDPDRDRSGTETFADVFVLAAAPPEVAELVRPHLAAKVDVDALNWIADLIHPAPAFPNDTIFRLYRAFFDRDPDRGGYDYWTAERARGITAQAVADWFATSPEFVATYGHLDDGAFVDLVYRNVLDREPDRAGRSYWVTVLASHTRGDVMLAFCESFEFVARWD